MTSNTEELTELLQKAEHIRNRHLEKTEEGIAILDQVIALCEEIDEEIDDE